MNTATCYISKKKLPVAELYKGRFLKKEILDLIKKDFPDFNDNEYISMESLNEYRKKYMASLLKQENAEISEMEQQVIESIAKNELLSKDLEEELSKDLTLVSVWQTGSPVLEAAGPLSAFSFCSCFSGCV